MRDGAPELCCNGKNGRGMKAVIKGIILVIIIAVVGFVGGAYLLPPEAVVERNRVIKAPPDIVYGIAGSLKRYNEWSPWYELDPKAEYKQDGPEQGVGQKLSWTSANPQVGKGTLTVTEAVPNEKLVTAVDMAEMGKWTTTMTFMPVNEGSTSVTWRFEAPLNGVMERWMSLGFDKWVGADFQKGLGNLETLAEKEAAGG